MKKKLLITSAILAVLITQTACFLFSAPAASRSNPDDAPVSQPTEEEEFTPIPFVPTESLPDPRNLIQNGYFLDDFEYWTRQLIDEGGSSKTNIEPFESSDFNRALHLEHEGLGNVQFYQTVPVNTLDLEFSVTFKAASTEGYIIGFSGSGYALIGLGYLDENEEMLGATRIINFNENMFAGSAFVGAPEKMQDTNTMHNIQIESDQVYKNYKINIASEVNNNLLGIDASKIRFIQIVFIAGSTDEDATADLYVSELTLLEK